MQDLYHQLYVASNCVDIIYICVCVHVCVICDMYVQLYRNVVPAYALLETLTATF